MYEYKIVVDSSCNLTNDYIKDDNIGFKVAPLTISIDDVDYVDDENINTDKLLDAFDKSTKSTTSCPSPYAYEEAYNDAKNVICITISSKLSGSYNSAFLGSNGDSVNGKVHVIDSKGTAGMMSLLVDKAYELFKTGKPFEEICDEMDEYQKSLNLLFILNKFDNLVRNGRMSKIAAFIASTLAIKPLCIADDGEIKVHQKLRTMRAAIQGLVNQVGVICPNQEGRVCTICYVKNEDEAQAIKKAIEEKYNFKEVRLEPARGLCTFYALRGGIIVSF